MKTKRHKRIAECELDYEVDGSGAVLFRKARSTGTHVGLYRSDESGIESDPDYPWSIVCEEHAGVTCHRTRKDAESYLSHPEEWCPTCQEHEREIQHDHCR
jgi:hypothetical protein